MLTQDETIFMFVNDAKVSHRVILKAERWNKKKYKPSTWRESNPEPLVMWYALYCCATTAAQITYLIWKSGVFHVLEGPLLRTHYWDNREEKKAQHWAGFELTTCLLQGMRSTAVLQPLPLKQIIFFLLPQQKCFWDWQVVGGGMIAGWLVLQSTVGT